MKKFKIKARFKLSKPYEVPSFDNTSWIYYKMFSGPDKPVTKKIIQKTLDTLCMTFHAKSEHFYDQELFLLPLLLCFSIWFPFQFGCKFPVIPCLEINIHIAWYSKNSMNSEKRACKQIHFGCHRHWSKQRESVMEATLVQGCPLQQFH